MTDVEIRLARIEQKIGRVHSLLVGICVVAGMWLGSYAISTQKWGDLWGTLGVLAVFLGISWWAHRADHDFNGPSI